MSFNPKVIAQGNQAKKQAQETPTSFATAGGSTFAEPSGSLDQKSQMRMAGPGGAFAMKMMQEPEFADRVAQWNQQFSQSNQGQEFNSAKMQQAGMNPDGSMIDEEGDKQAGENYA